MQLFEYALYYVPKGGGKSEILVSPTPILAKTEKQAEIFAARAIPETHLDKIDDVVIKVRPF